MAFKVISGFANVQTIARGKGIRELKRLKRIHGIANWRKKKGIASIQFDDGCFLLSYTGMKPTELENVI